MIVRFVKMTFKDNKTSDFEDLFARTKPQILQFEGCRRVDLFTETTNPSTYFTLSYWDSEADLNNYRASDFFRVTWSAVKPMFAAKAEAWSLTETRG